MDESKESEVRIPETVSLDLEELHVASGEGEAQRRERWGVAGGDEGALSDELTISV